VRRILAFIDGISTWTGKAVSVLSLFVAIIISYEIVARQVFNAPTTWAAESTVFACAVLYLLGGAWTLLQDGHVRVDVLHNRFSPRAKAIVEVITFVPFALYIGVMLWATSKYALQSVELRETTMTPWNPPIYPIKVVMVIAFVLLLLQQTAKVVRDLYFIFKGEQL
jgi:TRAP-type mannitol/chloroaromatic compound transport system permease small subunit